MFVRGDLVWAKLTGCPWWPAVIIDSRDCNMRKISKEKYLVFWLTEYKVSQISSKNVMKFEENFSQNVSCKKKSFEKAIHESLQISAERHQKVFSDYESLHKWASEGFKTSAEVKIPTELPLFIKKALEVLRSADEETDDEEKQNENAIDAVRRGLRKLEDVCIGCCDLQVKVTDKHPLFIGGLCQDCRKPVQKVCKLNVGRMQDICIICGQGGDLVICSSNLCFRSFCKLCIEYMAPDGAYDKIIKNDKWRCFLCDHEQEVQCLILRRDSIIPVVEPCFPSTRNPISVIAMNNTGLEVLEEKGIKVQKYCINPPFENMNASRFDAYSQEYKDFSEQELADIAPDLVIGSFFASSISLDDRSQSVEFFLKFNRFLFRLDIARLFKSSVFFIFIAEASLLIQDVISHCSWFLEIKPQNMTLNEKKFFLWSNVTNKCSFKFCKCRKTGDDEHAIEHKILSAFTEELKKYFEVC